MAKKGLEWNQLQLSIAKMLDEKVKIKDIALALECSQRSVYKVQKSIKNGDLPFSTDEAAIAAAAKPTIIGEAKPKTPEHVEEAPAKEKPVPIVPAYTSKNLPVKYTSAIKFVAEVGNVPIIPPIFISYVVAVMNGYNKDLVDWLGYCCEDFWEGRGRNMYEEYSHYDSHNPEKKEEEIGTPSG